MYLKDLRVKMLALPMGIAADNIFFGWKIISDKNDVQQTSYKIQVIHGGTLIWDSGNVASAKSVHVPYAGPALTEDTEYTWSVEVTNNHQETAVSESKFFIAISPKALTANWIETNLHPIKEEPKSSFLATATGRATTQPAEGKLLPATYMRRTFTLNKTVRSAHLYATAHGVYNLELNGEKVGNRFFAPEYTSYHNRILYQTYDVTALLQVGDNAIGAVIGDGWWGGRIHLQSRSCIYGNKHALFLQMMIEYEDGTVDQLISDESFRYATGPILYSDLFIGEKYDARLEMNGWSKADFDDSKWQKVVCADYGTENLAPQEFCPVQIKKEIVAKEMILTPKGETVIDFGQNMAGIVQMEVTAPKGTVITMIHAETLDKEGNFLFNIEGSNKDQTDIYICKGNGKEIFRPHFTYHGFRYIKLEGYPGKPKLESFKALVLSSNNEDTGAFTCSDERINQLQSCIYWSQISNFVSIPTDCPQREKSGYTGDIGVYIDTAMYN